MPLWRQLADRLTSEIEAGTLTGRVSSSHQLARDYQVGRATAVKAPGALAEAGLVVTDPGRGLDERPASRDQVRAAYRARLREVHPDLAASQAVPELR